MKKINFLLKVLFTLSITITFAQQDAQYTQYMYNQNIFNPAYAGSRDVLSLNMLRRTQWIGVNGAPQTLTLSIHSPVGKSIGLGLSVISDGIGPVKENNINADFSYTIHTPDKGNLVFGLKAGFTFLNIRSLEGLEADTVLNEPINLTSPNFGAGIYYYTQRFYIGLATPNFLETRYLEGSSVSLASEKTHYFFTTGLVFDLNDEVKLKPSAMVKAVKGAPISIDLSVNTLINDKFEIGINYRFDDSISAMFGIYLIESMRIGYAYDFTTSRFKEFNSGSHEISLIYELKLMKSKLKSPRYF